jgi:hypothetical protein
VPVTGREVLVLYNYFLFAHELRARDIRSTPLVCHPLSGGQVPEEVIIHELNMRGWHLALATVIEGWRDLKRKDPTFGDPLVDALLGRETGKVRKVRRGCFGLRRRTRRETFADLVVDARHDFAHFKPRYLPPRWRRLEVEAGPYPKQLHDAFEAYFAGWFHAQRRERDERAGG